jgi:hypothetical protein
MNPMEKIEQARQARERWEDACRAGMSHGSVLARWESYVRLANLAGKHVFAALEKEAAR